MPRSTQLLPAVLLCTGTLVVLANQWVTTQAAVSPKSQLLTLTRYLFTWGLSGLLLLRQQRTPAAGSTAGPSARKGAARHDNRGSRRLLVLLLLGGIDVSCYSLYNLGFSLAGAALATVTLAAAGQIATAVLSATVLRRQLRRGHIAAVAVVTLGLMVRSMDDVVGRSGSGSSSSSTTATTTGSREPLYGVLCITVSALLFSILGCAYESLMAPDAARPPGSTHATQAQTSFVVTGVSLAAALAHTLLYARPRWQELVAAPLAASGLTAADVIRSHALYGVITAAHQFMQLRLLASHGALVLGLVNAVRASAVSVLSSALFCATAQQQCLTPWRAISAGVVSLGAAQWVLAGKPVTRGAAVGGAAAGGGAGTKKHD